MPHLVARSSGLAPSQLILILLKIARCGPGYYTWALKRMPSIPEQAGGVGEVENHRRGLALVLAYVEGADDERSALSAVD